MMDVKEVQRLGVTYYKLAHLILKSIPSDDPTGDYTLHAGQSFQFLIAFGNRPLRALMEEFKEGQNPAYRYWACKGLNDFRELDLGHLRRDGTVLN